MNKEERRLKESTVIASIISVVAFAGYFISEMVGFDKMNPAATPKTFFEVLAEWPRLIGVSVIVFAAVWWWQMFQKEPETVICSSCREVFEKEKIPNLLCKKCGGKLEELEGFYDRHPDLR